MRPLVIATTFLCLVGAGTKPAARPPSTQIEYCGVHPLPGAAFCDIEVPHVHAHGPEHADTLYRLHEGRYYFVGDPVPFGYAGTKHAYHGHHPLALDEDRIHSFCYLDGPHYHAFGPPTAAFALRGGAYWYTGAWPAQYWIDAARLRRINSLYAPLVYARPVASIGPPPGFRASRAIAIDDALDHEDYDYDLYYHRHRCRGRRDIERQDGSP
jgi:hypothetical protein